VLYDVSLIAPELVKPPDAVVLASYRTRNLRRRFLLPTALVVLFWASAILLQVAAGAYRTEFAAYPDEPGHYVTGLMLRDYIASGLPHLPVQFAQDYYRHYPKVAFGHWPPFFYIVEASWMLLFTESRTSVMLLMALFTALSAAIVASCIGRYYGKIAGVASGLIWIALPVIQTQTSMVMLEMLFVALALLAVIELIRYLEEPTTGNALRFSFLTLLSIMTKGNGWLLVPAIAMAVLLSGRLYLVRYKSLWMAAGVIAVAAPVQMLTVKSVVSALPMEFGISSSIQSFAGFTSVTIQLIGLPIFLLALAGIGSEVIVPLVSRRWPTTSAAAMAGLLTGFLALHCIVPAGVEPRKLIVALPALLYFALGGATSIASYIRTRQLRLSDGVSLYAGVTLATLAVMALTSSVGSIPVKPTYGLASSWLHQERIVKASTWLVSGTGSFEGGAVAEAAMLGNRERHTVLRAFKVLADSDWNAVRYQSRYADLQQMRALLERAPVDVIAVETTPDALAMQHNALLYEALKQRSDLWRPLPPPPGQPTGCALFIRVQGLSQAALQQGLRDWLNLQVPAL
jgi:hypothetical protein